jgi:hypothetical protein
MNAVTINARRMTAPFANGCLQQPVQFSGKCGLIALGQLRGGLITQASFFWLVAFLSVEKSLARRKR